MSRKHLLKDSALERLGTLLAAVQNAEAADTEWRARANIHFLRNYTTEPLDPYITFHLMRDDLLPEITHGGYGTMVQELLDPKSPIASNPPDMLMLSQLVEFLDPAAVDSGWRADAAIRELNALLETLVAQDSSLVIANTFVAPIDVILDEQQSSWQQEIDRLNAALQDFAARHADRIVICDWSALIANLGDRKFIDRRFWRSSQAPFRPVFLDLYARRIASFVRARFGLAKKLLVLDCDNTLWGGIVGEDGLSGIELGPDSAHGAMFKHFQQQVAALHQQGVMVAICSKNNEADVWEVLENHPHAILRKTQLVTWRINWEDKASNIASMVRELNIGMDSVVFVDDNPRELALIADRLPEVTLLAVPDDLSAYENLLTRDGLFQTVSQSAEDRSRTRMYQEQHARSEERNRFEDLDNYLKSLETVARIGIADKESIGRIAQLTQKTNQFNLTTRRYTEAEIRAILSDPNSAVFVMAVSDRFGDMGKTGVFIAKRTGDLTTIDTLLLSCRILGRRLEIAFADQCMQSLERDWGVTSWRAEYIATRKNQQTESFWEQLGFHVVEGDDSRKTYASEPNSRDADYSSIIIVEKE